MRLAYDIYTLLNDQIYENLNHQIYEITHEIYTLLTDQIYEILTWYTCTYPFNWSHLRY